MSADLKDIRNAGWRQGSVLKQEDLLKLGIEDEGVGIVVSQSCDVLHRSLDKEPYVEILLGMPWETSKNFGNFLHGKNPRKHVFSLEHVTASETEEWVYTHPWCVHRIDRTKLLAISPDPNRFVPDETLRNICDWLARRYTREALPDSFNNVLAPHESKLREVYKRISPYVSGLYVDLHPDRELQAGESYEIRLLALVPTHEKKNLDLVSNKLSSIQRRMADAGISFMIDAAALVEDEISYADLREFRRLDLDDLSGHHTDHPRPLN